MPDDSTGKRKTGGSKTLAAGKILLFLALILLIALPFTPAMDLLRKVKRGIIEIVEKRGVGGGTETTSSEPKIIEREKIVEVEVEVQPPLPPRFVPYNRNDMAELWNGFDLKTTLNLEEGETTSKERAKDENFIIEMKMTIPIPKPNDSLEELEKLNPQLSKVLPDLPKMMETARVSGFYDQMYQRKVERMQTHLTRMGRLLTKHNFYDLETALELEHPETGQKVLFLQGEMDVCTDGSDGDRMPEPDEKMTSSTYYRYSTSYGWKKTTKQPNPLLPKWEKKLKEAESASSPSKSDIDQLKREIGEMKYRSFLLAKADPYMVIPLSFLNYHKKSGWGPKIGDYAIVIFENKAFPVLIGDAGPSFQMGEGSLRLAQAINEKAGPYSRPVSDMKVTYVVFPQTAESFGPPDLENWRSKCAELVEKIGGLGEGIELHKWTDFFGEDRTTAGEAATSPES